MTRWKVRPLTDSGWDETFYTDSLRMARRLCGVLGPGLYELRRQWKWAGSAQWVLDGGRTAVRWEQVAERELDGLL